ncbi:MAG: hypothetical protein COC15_02460 [Legionellales bacterium]|nr:MAG: hypothetical protein COC15_02460 [Legionellales bacterium]
MIKDKDINTKNTKNEILEAYNKLLKEIAESKNTSLQQQNTITKQHSDVKAAHTNTPEAVNKIIVELKAKTNEVLQFISTNIDAEYEKFSTLEKVVKMEEESLKQAYQITREADSLDALLLSQKRRREEFEKELSSKRNTFAQDMQDQELIFNKKKTEFIAQQKELEEETQKKWKREQEEYTYKINLDRKKDMDNYKLQTESQQRILEEKRIQLEKKFSEREATLLTNENELLSLRKQVEGFPNTLEKNVSEAEKRVKNELEKHHNYETELLQKGVEGTQKLNEQMICSLQNKSKMQEELIEQLTEKANNANKQVQDIAVKAIEGASLNKGFYDFRDGFKGKDSYAKESGKVSN